MPTKRIITLRLQDDARAKIQALAALEHRSINAEIETAVDSYIKEWVRTNGPIPEK